MNTTQWDHYNPDQQASHATQIAYVPFRQGGPGGVTEQCIGDVGLGLFGDLYT
jgi:hypothetical protein